ncbi:MAG: glycosidase [Verrucomicrobiales bacterium]|jgi:glycosidase
MDAENREALQADLELLYGDSAAEVTERIAALIERWRAEIVARPHGWSERDAMLITYADSVGAEGDVGLVELRKFLQEWVGDRISFLHLLPFYPWTSDDGFSVVDFREVGLDYGHWEDVDALAEDGYRMVFDGVVNHVSQESAYVRGFLDGDSDYEGFCIEEDPGFDSSQVTRPRTSPLFHEYGSSRGPVKLWTTFSRDQVDLNYREPSVLLEMLDVLLFYSGQGASMIRLDAIPFMWKKSGDPSVHLPQTHAFIRIVRRVFDLAAPHLLLLSETNVPHKENLTYFGDRGDEAQIIYNFSLAPLVIHAFATGDASVLSDWAKTLEPVGERCTFLNITATHDGIGMRPTEGILDELGRKVLTDLTLARGGRVSTRSNPDGSESPYELNITYFDAINDPGDTNLDQQTQVKRFLCSQAIAMAMMGIPAVYIHCLLGSRNDVAGRDASGIARRINREKLNPEGVALELGDEGSLRSQVLVGMLALLAQRQAIAAFHPHAAQEVLELGPGVFGLRRKRGDGEGVIALHNVTEELQEIGEFGDPLAPFEVRWLTVS